MSWQQWSQAELQKHYGVPDDWRFDVHQLGGAGPPAWGVSIHVPSVNWYLRGDTIGTTTQPPTQWRARLPIDGTTSHDADHPLKLVRAMRDHLRHLARTAIAAHMQAREALEGIV